MALPEHLDGFITKQQVSQLYPVSERTVQRHISNWIRSQETAALTNLALVTDDETRSGDQVTFEVIEELNRTGQKPRWYFRPSFAEETFGAKAAVEPQANTVPPSTPEPQGSEQAADAAPVEVVYLRQRVPALEQQLQEERERHDRIVAKLFAQLEVKDKQISAWDEVTQGLTKGLASGQLAPNRDFLPVAGSDTSQRTEPPRIVVDADHSAVTPTKEAADTTTTPPTPVSTSSRSSKPKQKRTRHSSTQRSKSKPRSRKKPATAKKAKKATTKPSSQPAKWYQAPTFKRFLGR